MKVESKTVQQVIGELTKERNEFAASNVEKRSRSAETYIKACNALLKLVTETSSRREYLDGVVRLMQEWSGCRCLGIRVRNQEGFIPYESYTGFSREFWERENWLSLTKDDCACIRVIKGEPEPQDACCMTEGGSFLVNDSVSLLDILSEEELARFRGVCIKSGFLSIAIIPVRYQGEILGAIHLADERAGMVPEEFVCFAESMTPLVGEGINKFNIKDSLERNYEILKKTNRALKVLSECNYAMAQDTDESELLDHICRITVNAGGYRLAWVGYAEQDRDRSVRPVAQAGYEAGYLESAKITWADSERGRGPVGTALRTGEAKIVRDCLCDPYFAPWREASLKRGYASVIALPLTSEGRVFGSFNIYAREPNAFDGEELSLLKTLAANLAFGISALRTRQKQRRAEEELRQREMLLRKILDTLPVGVWIVDETGGIIEGNAAGQAIWGGAKYVGIDRYGEYKGWWMDSGEPIEPGQWAAARAIRGGESSINELIEIEAFNGTRKIMLHSAVPLFDEHRKVSGAVVVNQDITELKRAEEALEEQRLLLDAILSQAADGIIATDANGRFLFTNAAARCKAFLDPEGTSMEDAERIWGEARTLNGHRIPLDKWAIQRALRGETTVSAECRMVHPEGSYCDVLISAAPLRKSDGAIAGAVATLSDITKHKEAEAALKAYAKRLELLNQDLQEFAFVASHDLQEPLRKIQSFGTRLSEKYKDSLDEDGKDYIERMTGAAKRMRGLLDGLLRYSRITTQANPFELIDLNKVVRDTVSDLHVAIKHSGGTVEVGPMPMLKADEPQMRQLFQNLIENALKYRAEERSPTVRVSAQMEDQVCRIVVEDNGIGFDEKYVDRIFKPFQRLHGRSSPYEGSGMGLAICKKIIERHEGTITARSAPGEGATFIISLPLNHVKREQ